MSRYGYTTESGVEIPPMIDMIDGGGPGQSGSRFEGGGIMSLLANLVAEPYGSVRPRPGYVEEEMVMRGGPGSEDATVSTTGPSLDEISPRAATEEDVVILQRVGGPEYFDIQPGDLLSINEVQMIEEARSAPAPAPAPAAPMMSAPTMAAPSVSSGGIAPFGVDPRLAAPRTPPALPAPAYSGAIPGPAGVPSTLEEIERMRINPQSPDFTFGAFGGP